MRLRSRPQTCYCSDSMSIKHLLIERKEREGRGRGWMESERRSSQSIKVITDNYGQEGRKEKSSNVSIHRRGRNYSLSVCSGRQLAKCHRGRGRVKLKLTPNGFPC